MERKLWIDESGQGMVEYTLIIAFIALVVVGAVTAIGTALNTKYESFSDAFGNNAGSDGGTN